MSLYLPLCVWLTSKADSILRWTCSSLRALRYLTATTRKINGLFVMQYGEIRLDWRLRSAHIQSVSYRQAGIGSSTDLPSDQTHLQNRAEVIRLLLVLLSPAVYSPNSPNPWLQHLLNISERKIALTLLCSLINTSLDVAFIESFQISTANAYKRLASLTLSAEAKIASDLADTLPKVAHQLLDLLLIASDAPSSPTISRTPSLVDTSAAPSRTDNIFRFYTSKIHRQSDYAFLAERILCILSVAPPSGLVGLSVPGWNLTECVVLLWRIVECNKVSFGVLSLVKSVIYRSNSDRAS